MGQLPGSRIYIRGQVDLLSPNLDNQFKRQFLDSCVTSPKYADTASWQSDELPPVVVLTVDGDSKHGDEMDDTAVDVELIPAVSLSLLGLNILL